MVRTANPLEAEIALIKSPNISASFLNCADSAAVTVPVVEVSVASEVWLSAELDKSQSAPIQSPQSINQWFPIPIVNTVVLASKVNVSEAVVQLPPEKVDDVAVASAE